MERRNTNIEQYNFEAKYNKIAFVDVVGDPFAVKNGEQSPILGQYLKLQQRSSIQAMKNDFDMGKATRNPAQPNVQDFLCDVDRIVMGAFKDDPETYKKFLETYILESEDKHFTPKERMKLEQKVGKLLRSHKLSPVSSYFTTIRR